MEVVDGNIDRFGILYERYKKPVYGYFYKLTSGDSQASEDLSHNVFFKALKYKHSFKGTGTFARWLFSIAHNMGIDYLRKNTRYHSDEIDPEIKDEEINGTESLELKESTAILNLSLNKLKYSEREILIMAKIKELKYSEIAEINKCSESAVKTRICRALKKLKDLYVEFEKTSYEKEEYYRTKDQRSAK